MLRKIIAVTGYTTLSLLAVSLFSLSLLGLIMSAISFFNTGDVNVYYFFGSIVVLMYLSILAMASDLFE